MDTSACALCKQNNIPIVVFDFDSENIDAVKDAIHLSSHDGATLYGKTGTGRIDGQDVTK